MFCRPWTRCRSSERAAPRGEGRTENEITTEEQIERLSGIAESLAASVVAHDNRIEAHTRQIEALIKTSAEKAQNCKNLER
jgi:hypothetical protein